MTNSSVWAGTTESVRYNVYQGVWTNWSRGRVMGATLTLDRIYGNLLIAFTATFVAIVASATWRICCFCFHRIYSTSEPRDALHHQRQAILRNSSSAASAFWTMCKVVWTWRRDSKQLLLRTLPALVLSGLCFCLFTVAAGFSSTISSGMGNEVVLNGDGCGVVYMANSSATTVSPIKAYLSQSINNAANYAQECYSNNPTGNFDCTNFVKNRLPGTIDDQAECPFQDGICRSNQSNLLLDSGYIDSREHCGLNTPDGQRIFFRTRLNCAPLHTAGFSENISTSVNNYTRYFYGPSTQNLTFTWQTEDLNAQYVRPQDNKLDSLVANMGLSVMYATTVNKTAKARYSLFEPDPRLFRPDADLYLIFLSGNGVGFYDPTEDPWYRTFIPWKNTTAIANDVAGQWYKTVYRPEEAASPMGCIQQHQYCNAEHECGELGSSYDAQKTAANLFGTQLNGNTSGQALSEYNWFQTIIYSSYDIMAIIKNLGTASLASRGYFNGGYMSQISNEQWKLDVTHWWATLMALKQSAFVNTAQGPKDPSLQQDTLRPDDKYMEALCRNQKIRNTDYTSFSLFGLLFTFILGVLIILASYLIEPIFHYLATRRKYQEYKFLEWTGNETLHLQRMAYEGLSSEPWSGHTDPVPKTRPGYYLPDLHAENCGGAKNNVGTAIKRGAPSQARSRTDQPNSVTLLDRKDSTAVVQVASVSSSSPVSPVSNEAALPGAVSSTRAPFLNTPPEQMAGKPGSDESFSQISRISSVDTSGSAKP